MTDLLPPVLETESERLFAGTFIADQGVDTTSCPPAPTLTIPGLQSALSMDSSTDVGTVQLAPESLLKERAGCSGLRRIATSVLPTPAPKSGDAYLRFTPRTEMDIAVCSAAVNLTLGPKGVVTAARVVLGAVAPTVVLVPAAAKAIIGSTLDDDALANLAAACEAACAPIDDKRGTVEFRTEVAGVLARRAAKLAYERAGGK